jgi:hypothetical protein
MLEQAASLAWFDAAKGWRESLEPAQAVALQCCRLGAKWDDYKNHPDTLEMTERVRLAIKSGALAHKTTTTSVCVKPERHVTPPELSLGAWPEQYTRGGMRYAYTEKAVFKDKTTHHITAEAFAVWLAANEIEPSRHVAAWFKAMAVNTDHRPIEPPAGWKAHMPQGLQKFEDSDAGRLVRLADLVQWLMDTKELPCKAATEEVCSRLEQRPIAAAGWLYLLQRNDFATPLTPEHSFYWLPRNAPPDDNPGDPNDNGVAGAINNMRRYWADCDSPDACKFDGAKGLAPVAIPVDVAHLQWGYGRRVEAAEQPQAAAPALSADPVGQAPAGERRVLKKNVLVQELEGEWPTIKEDLSEASRNGLNAAKAEGHGNWDVDRAKAWAESKGKLVKSADVHTLPNRWPGQVTRHRAR